MNRAKAERLYHATRGSPQSGAMSRRVDTQSTRGSTLEPTPFAVTTWKLASRRPSESERHAPTHSREVCHDQHHVCALGALYRTHAPRAAPHRRGRPRGAPRPCRRGACGRAGPDRAAPGGAADGAPRVGDRRPPAGAGERRDDPPGVRPPPGQRLHRPRDADGGRGARPRRPRRRPAAAARGRRPRGARPSRCPGAGGRRRPRSPPRASWPP